MTDFEISTRVGKERVKGREEKPAEKKRLGVIDRFAERMMPKVSSRQEHEKQLLIIRLIICVLLPVCLILASAEYILTRNVNPFLLSFGSGLAGSVATMLKINGPDDKPK